MGTPDAKSEASSYRANIQMQGFAAGDVEPGTGMAGPLSRTAARDPGAGANPENFLSASVRSEPDVDTILPLPGSYSHSQSSPAFPFRNWSGRTARKDVGGVAARAGAGAREEGSDDSSEEDLDVERSLVHSPRSIGFTNVEVHVSL